MQGQEPDFVDVLNAKLPPGTKWCFTGMGAAAGWYYARAADSPIPLSYIIGGAAAGFCLLALLRAGLRLAWLGLVAGAVLLVVNYALLIPFGKGDHLPGWIDNGKATLRWLDPSRMAGQWGKSVEIRPGGR